jgi:signal transduction histidine kinase
LFGSRPLSETQPQPVEIGEGMPAELSQLRLVDSMMHEARNPLNAIAIHLEIVSEKLRKAGASVNVDSNLQAIRSQLARVDELLRKFGSFMLPKKRGDGAFPLSSTVELAIELLDYERRRKNVEIDARIEAGLTVQTAERSVAPSLVLVLLLSSLDRAPSGSRVGVSVAAENGRVAVVVSDSGIRQLEADFHSSALEALCIQSGAKLIRREDAWVVMFPGIQPS